LPSVTARAPPLCARGWESLNILQLSRLAGQACMKEVFRDAGLSSRGSEFSHRSRARAVWRISSYPCVLKPLSLSRVRESCARTSWGVLAAAARFRRLLKSRTSCHSRGQSRSDAREGYIPGREVAARDFSPTALSAYWQSSISPIRWKARTSKRRSTSPVTASRSVQRALEKCARDSARAWTIAWTNPRGVSRQRGWSVATGSRAPRSGSGPSPAISLNGQVNQSTRRAAFSPRAGTPRMEFLRERSPPAHDIPVPRAGFWKASLEKRRLVRFRILNWLSPQVARCHCRLAGGSSYLGFFLRVGARRRKSSSHSATPMKNYRSRLRQLAGRTSRDARMTNRE